MAEHSSTPPTIKPSTWMREALHRDYVRDDAFATAIRTADINALNEALGALQYCEHLLSPWPRIVSAVEQLDPPAKFRRHCLQIWLSWGDGLRSEVNDDLLLIRLLRVLLPKYTGPALTLYRGDTFWNRRRRTYGIAWTTNIAVARNFANRPAQRMSQGGSVVLKTVAPAAAIICAPKLLDNRYAEHEILVDRRRLHRIDVAERISESTQKGAG